MERHGKTHESIKAVEKAFKLLIRSSLTINEAIAQLESDSSLACEIKDMIDFIKRSKCGLSRLKEKEKELVNNF